MSCVIRVLGAPDVAATTVRRSAGRKRLVVIAALILETAACAGNQMGFRTGVSDLDCVLINGEEVITTGDKTLLELLRGRVTPARILEPNPPEEQPLVMIDGTATVNGIDALAGMPAYRAFSVTILRAAEAFQRYGERAYRGAVIVRTKQSGTT
jgi:hypothetical protein